MAWQPKLYQTNKKIANPPAPAQGSGWQPKLTQPNFQPRLAQTTSTPQPQQPVAMAQAQTYQPSGSEAPGYYNFGGDQNYSKWLNEEIRRKAERGESLLKPNEQKQRLWDSWNNWYKGEIRNKAEQGIGLERSNAYKDTLWNEYTNFYKGETQKKAQTGQPLQDSNPWKDSIYDKYKLNTDEIDFDKYRTENATIDDLAKKYGFDYSRDYAKRQAEAEAQARRNAVEDAKRRNESNTKTGKAEIDSNLMGMAEGLDRNYFQQYMQQAQNQVNGGVNSGIAADQDLRLAMMRQTEMGDAYRDANLGKMRLNEEFNLNDLKYADELGLINQEAIAREDSLYNDRLSQAFSQLMTLDDANRTENLALLQAAMEQRGMNLDQENIMREYYNLLDRQKRQDMESDRDFGLQKDQFNWQKILDESGLTGKYKGQNTMQYSQWLDEFYGSHNGKDGWQKQKDNREYSQWLDEFYGSHNGKDGWDKQMDKWNQAWEKYKFGNMSASELAQLQMQQSQFSQQLGWDQFQFNNMSAAQQMEYEMRMRELQQALAAGQGYDELSPQLKAFIDQGGKIQNHSVVVPGFNGGSLGSLSAKYESSGDIGTIANNSGDWGGKSYGKYQIATNTGTMKGFMSWLKQADSSFYQALARSSPGSSGFDSTWKALAKNYPQKFEQLQHGFIKSTHYDPVVTSLTNTIGLNVNKRSGALQNVIWSLGVQHGAGGASNLVKAAGVKPGMSDRQIIDAIYRERSKVDKYFSRSSASIRRSVYNRFQKEWKDAISMLG